MLEGDIGDPADASNHDESLLVRREAREARRRGSA
jgi:hypothetical protein